MTEKQILLVKHSWSYVASHLDDLVGTFGKKVAQVSPELKPLLKRVNDENGLHSILTTINQVVATLPEFNKAEQQVLLLLAAYAGKGISRENYDAVLIAFLLTLEKKLGKHWSAEIRESWIYCFASIHHHFIRQLQLASTLLPGRALSTMATF
jgi:hemoglobin-like flavoprotein